VLHYEWEAPERMGDLGKHESRKQLCILDHDSERLLEDGTFLVGIEGIRYFGQNRH